MICLAAAGGLWNDVYADQPCRKTIHRMHQDDNIEMLMARYQQGDSSAASVLVHRVSPQLHRFFAAQSFSRADADDLLQETWLRIHRVRHTYRPGEPALPWFYAIARHIRVDHYRKSIRVSTREQRLETESIPAAPGHDPSVQADGLTALLAPLSPAERETVVMLKVTGMSLEEVACATSSTVGSVKQKAHRAYKKLRTFLSTTQHGSRQRGGRS
jgi:RNA polymerase sigma-70 factor (ECF subfamily)